MKKWLIPALLSFCLAIVLTWPSIMHISSSMIGDGGDGYQFAGFQFLANRLLHEGQFPFGWTHFWRYPYGVDFQNISDASLFINLGLILYSFINNPILIYNLSVLFLFWLNILISYTFFRSFFETWESFAGAVMYGASFFVLGKLGGHVNLILTSSFPLLLLGVLKIYDENGSVKSFILTTIALLLLAFSSLQFPLILVGSMIFIVPLAFIFYKTETLVLVRTIGQKYKSVLIFAALFLLVFWLFHGNKISSFINGSLKLPSDQMVSVPMDNFFTPNFYLKTFSSFISNSSNEWIEFSVFFGFVEIGLLAGTLFVLKESKLKSFLSVILVLFFLISLGNPPGWGTFLPYKYLFPILPYRGIIEPGRFTIITTFALVFLGVMLLAQLKNKTLIIAITILLILERLPSNFRLSSFYQEKSMIRKVKELPSRAVLDLPIYTDWWNGQLYDMYSIYYEKPIVNGYFHWSGNTDETKKLTDKLGRYTCYYQGRPAGAFDKNEAEREADYIVTILKSYGIRTIVIHKDISYNDPRCSSAKEQIEVLTEGIRAKNEYESSTSNILWIK